MRMQSLELEAGLATHGHMYVRAAGSIPVHSVARCTSEVGNSCIWTKKKHLFLVVRAVVHCCSCCSLLFVILPAVPCSLLFLQFLPADPRCP